MVVILYEAYQLGENASGSLNLLCLGLKEMSSAIISISSMDMSFILKSMVRVERPIIVEFMLRDQLLMSLKLIIMGS